MAVSSIGQELVDEYLRSLSHNVSIILGDNGYHLLTPFIRPDGESIGLEIALLPNGDFCLSDMGDTLGYLYVNGLTSDYIVPDFARSITGTYGASFKDNAITISSCREELGDSVHNLIQAVLAVTSFAKGRAAEILRKPMEASPP